MTTSASTDAAEYVEFFFILTAQLPGGDQATISDTVTVTRGASRIQVYRDIRDFVARELGDGRFTVLFFSLELNQL
ncbi:hypothetical protein ACWGI9_06780 [Streptomyces sp. NPDC054833]